MDDGLAVYGAIVGTIGLLTALGSVRYTRASAREQKRANDVAESDRRNALRADLRMEDHIEARIYLGALVVIVPIANLGPNAAHHLRLTITYGYSPTSTNELVPAEPIETLESDGHVSIWITEPKRLFEFYDSKAIVQLHFDDREKQNKMVTRNAHMSGSHGSGAFQIRYEGSQY